MTMSCLRFRFLLVLCCVFASSFLMIKALVVGHADCRPDQIQALLQFKNEFESRACNQTDYFNGVRCDNATGAVTKLQLPSSCFTGTLKPNSILFGFHHLGYLNLSHNNFTSSSLPSGLSNLNRLQVLSLSSNGFIGQVPSSFSILTKLAKLDLSHNELTGGFQLVQNLTKLSILDLSYNQFSGSIPSTLLMMPFLSSLDLRGNHLTGPIEVSNTSSSRLEHLFLGHNHFDGKILEPISKLTTLKDLVLSFINVSDPIDLKLFSSLKSLLNLELSGNIISATSISSDPDVPPKLNRLMMKNCNISEFPKFLKTLQNLERLELSNNRIKGKVPEWLWSLPRLSIVSLSNNSFNGFDGSAQVLGNSSVTMLDFSLNAFTGPLHAPPLSIRLFLASSNSFTGDIPLSTCKRSSLEALDLSYNNLSGSIPQCLSKLKIVNLRRNNLQGSIPDTFYSNSLLQTLDVGYNQISGKLPRSLVNCSFLRFLSVEHNNIKDVFPFWLKVLPDLQVLTLHSNTFYGPLGFPELRILDISENNFTGRLSPDYFVNWSVSSNKMYGDGKMYMGDYTDTLYSYFYALDLKYKGLLLEYEKVNTFYVAIDFSANRLSGQIPESIGLLTTLIALNLSNNSFTGQIPMSFANVTQLESLDLSCNKLSGYIPQELGSLSFLAYINVSHNQLMGEIPKGTQISGQPKSSFEGNAGLCGLPLHETCSDTSAPPTQRQKQEDDQEEKEVMNWKGVAIGYWPGVLFGLPIGHIVALYKPEWLFKIIGRPDRGRNR
ncbi:hypothetical protein EUTSA_v10016279mg [Eutrema salsugineum]|uniref:Leucine-rich repeat-containing N-terminal plant-type domain-containing protein n=1 Tax=Eutrema salsugineum TaxID=72664 RepID=V4NY92_EUTSA|nr:hypothetical protein EUTSA_v10016279mg [Eutrema salsugineum]